MTAGKASWTYANQYEDRAFRGPFGESATAAVVHAADTEEVLAVMADGNLAQAYCQFLDAAARQAVSR